MHGHTDARRQKQDPHSTSQQLHSAVCHLGGSTFVGSVDRLKKTSVCILLATTLFTVHGCVVCVCIVVVVVVVGVVICGVDHQFSQKILSCDYINATHIAFVNR